MPSAGMRPIFKDCLAAVESDLVAVRNMVYVQNMSEQERLTGLGGNPKFGTGGTLHLAKFLIRKSGRPTPRTSRVLPVNEWALRRDTLVPIYP